MLPELNGMIYEDRRRALDLATLDERKTGGDLMTNKCIRGYNNVNTKHNFEARNDTWTGDDKKEVKGSVGRDVGGTISSATY